MYAVIEFQWHQYIVEKWSELSVDKLDLNGKKTYTCDNVLMVFDTTWDKVDIWKPWLKWVKVEFDIIEELQKDKKIKVTKFKRKNRYHRNIWFRAQKTVLKVKDIKLNG